MSRLLTQIAEKNINGINEEAKLRLERYLIDPIGARISQRPVDSIELALTLVKKWTSQMTILGTSSQLGERNFRKLYDAIKNEKDFRRVNRFLKSLDNETQPLNNLFNNFLKTL